MHQYSEKKNVLSNRPKTGVVWTGSRKSLGSEFHVAGPVIEKDRRPYERSTSSIRKSRRPSNEWYDDSCRSAKRHLRSLERAARRAGPLSDTTLPAVIAWRTERRRYFDMVQQKRSEYWTARIDSERLQPHRLWKSFDRILGHGQTQTVSDIDASVLHRFFDDKVAGVRDATAGAPPPQFSAAPV